MPQEAVGGGEFPLWGGGSMPMGGEGWILPWGEEGHLRTISRMVTGCAMVAGWLWPAMFTLVTRNMSFSPVGSPFTMKPQRSTSSVLPGIHSSAGGRGHRAGQGGWGSKGKAKGAGPTRSEITAWVRPPHPILGVSPSLGHMGPINNSHVLGQPTNHLAQAPLSHRDRERMLKMRVNKV